MKARLSAYLKKVRAGHTILILDRDDPVARLEPIGGGDQGPAQGEDRLARLERAGLVRRAGVPLRLDEVRAGAVRASASVVDALLDDRRSGR